MKYAKQISEVLNAFDPSPLKDDQMEKFYCGGTMEYRMSDKYDSPMEDIFDSCKSQEGCRAYLLLGHRGCGKSTELNRMSEKLTAEGYYVETVNCSIDLDLLNMAHSDLFILMGEALLNIAEQSDCRIDEGLLKKIENFWREGTETMAAQEAQTEEASVGMAVGADGLFAGLFGMLAKIKTDLKFNEETRKEYRRKISVRSSEWIGILDQVAGRIAEKSDGKRPIIIFEDLDKLNSEDAWKVFYNYAVVLSGMSFPVIYTFPIGLSYDKRFSAMESYFETKTLPMIKIETIDGEPFKDGIAVICEIVEKRASLALFEENVLEELIQYTGGSLRDLFHAVNTAAKRAQRRDSETVSMEDAKRALEELKTSLTRRIEAKDYPFLLDICRGNRERIEDKEKLLNMLQASAVLEYNGRRWHNVHPLVVKFFEEQGMIGDE